MTQKTGGAFVLLPLYFYWGIMYCCMNAAVHDTRKAKKILAKSQVYIKCNFCSHTGLSRSRIINVVNNLPE